MSAILKMIKLLATTVGKAAHSAAENGIGAELRERFGEFVRRVRRGGLIFVGMIGGLIAYSLIFGSIDLLLWIIALPLAAMAALLSLLWPTHARLRRLSPNARDLATLARRTRLLLVRRMGHLPLAAREAARIAIGHLDEIASDRSGSDADPLRRGEAERLIGRYLPRLVESYCMLSARERRQDGDADQHLTEGLTAIAAELGELSQWFSKTKSDRFEVERRFISLRFPNHGAFAGVR